MPEKLTLEIDHSELEGRRWDRIEVAQAVYDAGWRRRNLNIMCATIEWESARYERARLVYTNGESDDGLGQVNSLHRGDTPRDVWNERVWTGGINIEMCRGIYQRRFEAYDSSDGAFRAWYAYSNGNFLRSWQVCCHAAAQVDPTYWQERSFMWWKERWVQGDLAIFQEEWKKRDLSKKKFEDWRSIHDDAYRILKSGSRPPLLLIDPREAAMLVPVNRDAEAVMASEMPERWNFKEAA